MGHVFTRSVVLSVLQKKYRIFLSVSLSSQREIGESLGKKIYKAAEVYIYSLYNLCPLHPF